MRLLTVATTALLLSACGAPQRDVITHLADNVLLPAHQHWADSNRALADHAQRYCSGDIDLDALHSAFGAARHQWAALQPQLVGPMSEGNRSWQVQFYPDKRNLVARQAEELLDAHPQLDHAQLADASVVVQGLSAFEYVLFDDSIDLPAQRERYCPLLIAIGQHQQQLAQEMVTLWEQPDGMLVQLKAFPNARYAEPRDALADILRVQITGLDTLKKKLGTPMGRLNRGVPQPFQAEAWRSRQSLDNLRATVEGAQAIWQAPGVRELVSDNSLATRIDDAYTDVLTRLDSAPASLVELVQDTAHKAWLDALYDSLNTLHRLHQNELAAALEIQIGFNANDGD